MWRVRAMVIAASILLVAACSGEPLKSREPTPTAFPSPSTEEPSTPERTSEPTTQSTPAKYWTYLSPGDCVLNADVFEVDVVTDVRTVDCYEPHDLQVITTLPLEGDYPGDDQIVGVADEMCLPHAQAFVADKPGPEWAYYFLFPTGQAHLLGERTVVCLVGIDGAQLFQPY